MLLGFQQTYASYECRFNGVGFDISVSPIQSQRNMFSLYIHLLHVYENAAIIS